MRILLVKPKHIGDTLILTPTIMAIRRDYPGAEIWVVVRRGCEGILAGCPSISRILTVAAVEKHERRLGDLWKELKTIWEIYTHRFDYAFELGDGRRGLNMLRLSQARRRFSVKSSDPWMEFTAKKAGCKISKSDWRTCHRVEKDFYSVAEFLPLASPIPPLCFEREFARSWAPAEQLGPFAVMQIGKRQGKSRWHREGWEEVGRHLLERFGALVITSGASEYEIGEAAWLRDRLGPGALCTLGQADWSQVAGLLYRARIYVGLDTATMHLAAACQCPVVALFGPTIEDHWHPWRAPYRIVTSPGYVWAEDVAERDARVRKRTMNEIEARDVVAACEALLTETASLRP